MIEERKRKIGRLISCLQMAGARTLPHRFKGKDQKGHGPREFRHDPAKFFRRLQHGVVQEGAANQPQHGQHAGGHTNLLPQNPVPQSAVPPSPVPQCAELKVHKFPTRLTESAEIIEAEAMKSNNAKALAAEDRVHHGDTEAQRTPKHFSVTPW